MQDKPVLTKKVARTPDVRRKNNPLAYVFVGFGLVLLLVGALYGVNAYKNPEKSNFSLFNSANNRKVVVAEIKPFHDEAPSRIKQFGSELEQDCYLAFAGSVCGYQREGRRARNMTIEFINQLNKPNPSAQVQACAKGVERIHTEIKAMEAGQPHCNTVRDIVQGLKTSK